MDEDARWKARIEASIEELAETTLGKRRSHIAGGGREENGLTHRIAELSMETKANGVAILELKAKLENGGLRVKLTPTQWSAITALIGLAAVLVRALIVGDPTPTP